MKVDINGQQFKIEFCYQHKLRFWPKTPISVTCKIWKQTFPEPVSTGTARVALGVDNFDRRIGRKLALKRALAPWPREHRRIFWGVYTQTCNL